jgi:hypothetical protein
MSTHGTPKMIKSPFSGAYIKPMMRTREDATNIYTEAIYNCPSSGQFVQKILISVEPKKSR